MDCYWRSWWRTNFLLYFYFNQWYKDFYLLAGNSAGKYQKSKKKRFGGK